MSRITPLLFAAALLAQPAQAGVTYTWHQTAASPTMPPGLNLELVFSDAAVRSGKLALEVLNECDIGGPCLDPQDSLLSLRYWFHESYAGATYEHNLIDYRYRSEPLNVFDHIMLDVVFLPGGLLGGSIFAADSNSDFSMQGAGGMFSMVAAHSDEFFGCGILYPECAGGEGVIRAERADREVPEPSSALLAGLGLAAAWSARRARRRAA